MEVLLAWEPPALSLSLSMLKAAIARERGGIVVGYVRACVRIPMRLCIDNGCRCGGGGGGGAAVMLYSSMRRRTSIIRIYMYRQKRARRRNNTLHLSLFWERANVRRRSPPMDARARAQFFMHLFRHGHDRTITVVRNNIDRVESSRL